MELNFTVTNQRIKYVSNLYIVEKSKNYLTAKFSFSGSEWKNVAKTAIFKKDDNVINVLLDENGRCTVPWELITRGTLKVSVFGGDLVTVDTAEVKILKSGYEEGNAPSEPTSDVYAQILAELQRIRDDFITEEMLGQAVEDWLAENVVEALSPADVEKIVYDYLDEHKDELKGEKGAVFTPHVSDEGVMSWTNNGGLENPPPVDLKINAGSDYALLTEAGYSLALSIDSNYVMTISLKNKAGEVLDSKHIDFPIESMVVNATYKNGVVTFTLQNGNVLDVDISELVRGLVPTSRTIAGIDLEDDVTKEELQNALEIYDSTVMGGELKPWLYDTENEVEIGVYNGKPLYRECINIESLPNDTSITVPVCTDIESVTCLEGYMIFSDGNVVSMISPRFDQGDYESALESGIHLSYNKANSGIFIQSFKDRSSASGFVILEYTKTTDAEGSGNNLNPYGIYSAKLDEVKADIEELQNAIVTTDSTTLENSHAGRLLFNEIIGGMEQDSTSGKNLLENTSSTITAQGITFTVNKDKSITVKGTNTGSAYRFNVGSATLEAGDYKVNGNNDDATKSFVMFNKQDGSLVQQFSGNDVNLSLTESATINYYITVPANATVDTVVYPMIRLATETDATYEPFTNGASPNSSYPQPINGSVIETVRVHWKNLLNPATAIDNKYQNSGNYGYIISDNAEYWISDFIPVEEGQVISLNHAAATIAVYDINKSGIKFYYSLEKRITITSGGRYAVFCYPKSRVEFGGDVMVCEGTDATYEPYQSKEIALSQPITLYNDVLGENVERKYKKVVFNGSNYNVTTATIGGYNRFSINGILQGKKEQTSGGFVDLLVSHFTVDGHPIVTNAVDERACGYWENNNLYIRCDRFATVEEFNAYFAENPMTVVYAIEPTTEELPTVDKIALNSLPTYDGITYVEFVDVGVQPSVSIDYGTSKIGGMTLESLLTARNNDLRLSSLEASVVNNI